MDTTVYAHSEAPFRSNRKRALSIHMPLYKCNGHFSWLVDGKHVFKLRNIKKNYYKHQWSGLNSSKMENCLLYGVVFGRWGR